MCWPFLLRSLILNTCSAADTAKHLAVVFSLVKIEPVENHVTHVCWDCTIVECHYSEFVANGTALNSDRGVGQEMTSRRGGGHVHLLPSLCSHSRDGGRAKVLWSTSLNDQLIWEFKGEGEGGERQPSKHSAKSAPPFATHNKLRHFLQFTTIRSRSKTKPSAHPSIVCPPLVCRVSKIV